MMSEKKRVAVIGGGPAGMLAASTASRNGCRVTLYEQNEKLGKKLYITGKGRCNITNSADMDDFPRAVFKNPKFLYSAFNSFSNKDIVKIINENGVPTKVERGGRIFPVSDKSSDVLKALEKFVKKSGVDIQLNSKVLGIEAKNGKYILCFEGYCSEPFDMLVIATGGASYPQTGSRGDGYKFASEFGHGVVDPRPSLVQLKTAEKYPSQLAGLTLKNIRLSAYRNNKRIYSDIGELLFTHTGVSGPLALTLSGFIADSPQNVRLEIDLKPGLTPEQLDKRIIRDFEKYTKKQLKNALSDLLPLRLISVTIELSNIDPYKIVDDITRIERERLVKILKALPLTVIGTGELFEAVITRGGVKTSEINPSTMESKLMPGLYFAGEVIDVDAQTGGFNLQIAYSTGYLAGASCAKALLNAEDTSQ